MKVNIKHLGLLASITIAILFAGCSDKDVEDRGRNGPDNNERISAQITLKQNGGYTRAVSSAPTDAEKKINSATIYIFDAVRRLEKTVNFAANATVSEEFTITSGLHYFLAAINYPGSSSSVPGIIEGSTTLPDAKQIILNLEDMTSLITTKGYYMTNVVDQRENLENNEEMVKL